LFDGYKRAMSSDFPGSIPEYKQALQLDPNFALAWSALAGAEAGLGPTPEARRAGERAFALRDRVTAPSRFQIENVYYLSVTRDKLKASSVAAQWVKNYPDDFAAHYNFVACLLETGRVDQALAGSREVVRLFPAAISYEQLVQASIFTGRFPDALAALNEAQQRGFDIPSFYFYRTLLAFLQHDERLRQDALKWAADHPGTIDESHVVQDQALTSGYYGHFQELARYSALALSAARSAKNSDAVTEFIGERVQEEVEAGHTAEAKRLAASAMATTDRYWRLGLALGLARAGDINSARKIALEEDREAPSDSDVQFYLLPAVRAAIELQQNNPRQAVEVLRPALEYELASINGISNIYPAYLRGLAYLQLHQGSQAAAEFQKLIDHPGLVMRNVIGALTRLQMARAQQMAGNTTAALHYYEEFLTLWKDADADLQPLNEAKAEYARLHVR
jgi:eukaryotic-like serine/threonine-protein kinase